VRLAQTPNGVETSADFGSLGATAVTVQLYSNGVYVAVGQSPGPWVPPDNPLILDRWPERLALMGTNGTVRLTSSEYMNIAGFVGDEIRLVPELPPESVSFDFASELTVLGSAGMQSQVYDLRRVAACVPVPLQIKASPGGTVISWTGEGYRLLGAETPEGPWLELSVTSPFRLAPTAPQRYFRLVCE
jgi:hypothetical protein